MSEKSKALMMSSVASMIDLFNADNINILLELGYDVHVATNFEFGSITSQERVDEYRQELEARGIKTFQLPVPRSLFAIKNILTSYKKMKRLVEENQYQIVHCHSPIGGVIARLACIKARKTRTKVIYTAHGFHFFKGAPIKNWLIFYPVEKICSLFTDVLITINQEDYSRAKKFWAKEVEYVPGIGVDVEKIRSTTVNRSSMRKEFGLNDDDYVILSVGQLSKRKNHEVIIKALSKIEDNNVKYLLCGFGELEDYLKQLAKNLGVEDRIIFAGYRKNVYEILQIVDCFAFPSLQEGLPVSLMEAMAAGVPVVCSRIRGNVDLIVDGENGVLCEPTDVDAFEIALTRMITGDIIKKAGSGANSIYSKDIRVIRTKMKTMYSHVKSVSCTK